MVTTSYDPEAVTVGPINPTITVNTAVKTSDDHHPVGLYPFIKGGPSCFFCPPGIDDGGFFLFGMNYPGIFPPPPTPPFPGVRNFPTITIGDDLNPTPDTDNEEQPTSTGANPSAGVTGSITSASSKRASKQWMDSAAKGATNYQKWQDKSGDDVPILCDFDEQFNFIGSRQASISRNKNILELFQSLGMDTSIQSWSTAVTWPKGPGATADYTDMFNA